MEISDELVQKSIEVMIAQVKRSELHHYQFKKILKIAEALKRNHKQKGYQVETDIQTIVDMCNWSLTE